MRRLDTEALAKERLEEAMKELDVAEVFLREGLVRNAAGKAFQAWKAFLSYLALRNVHLLQEKYRGNKRVGNVNIPFHEWIAAVVPTNRMTELSAEIERIVPGVAELTAMALQLHEYQYNGPDPEGIRSKIPNDETAMALIKSFITRARTLMNTSSKESSNTHTSS
ncbi:PaREP1 family protein [Vulcanisaeta sp. JCM 16161]|uniref:PaREP1 family protein n=1 Tax=Vulcanisaeta sp. JCM 16161 TaxID=1295372 RepID=UPI0006D000DA|nr:PaREP1 family protein [Vulcanisaeta sp. JCM 16161]